MTEIITNHKGTIDKYIGDCIMAFWNAPLDDPDHAKNAVRAVQDMRRALIELNRQWEAEAAAAGKTFSPVKIGIGLNTGECGVGNFGSMKRFDYSLLGDPVNLASRLESLGKVYGIDVIIGEETAVRLDDTRSDRGRCRAVKGKTQASRIYTIPPEKIAAPEALQQHQALLAAYRHQEWSTALSLLNSGSLGRAAIPCSGIRSLQAADRAIPDRAAAGELGRRIRASGEMTGPDRGASRSGDGVYTWRETTMSPITSMSILVRRKQSSASSGRQTIGSFSLNDVLSTSGIPVRSRNNSISR